MFGKNTVTGPYSDRTGGTIKVTQMFYTLQGEGPDAGRPAIFLRLTHCNLRCYFCDTQFDEGITFTLDEVVESILMESRHRHCNLLVITGGEPLLQNIVPLVRAVNTHGIAVSVETAGTTHYDELNEVFSPVRAIKDNLIVCSPKTPKINPDLERLVGAWKYIIKAGETGAGGFPAVSTQTPERLAHVFIPNDVSVPVYFQAMDEQDPTKNEANLRVTAQLCMKYGHRMSVQMHKLANLE